MSTVWTRDDVARLATVPRPEFAVIGTGEVAPLVAGLWLWDFWPALTPAGTLAEVAGGEPWFALSSPVLDAPDARHAVARIRMLMCHGGVWRDAGPAFPNGFTPGSREWSGCAVVDGDRLSLWFTAAGRRGEGVPTFEQRIFVSEAKLSADGLPRDWSAPLDAFSPDPIWYAPARERAGRVGAIEGFRDPYWFRDPADGREHVFFTGTMAGQGPHSGCIGHAVRDGAAWVVQPPPIVAPGLNGELERPHIVAGGGGYTMYFSTQAHVFADGIDAPTGLYAFTAATLAGPWKPVGGHGLVRANPAAASRQAYSWFVAERRAWSFVDVVGGAFRGTLAPVVAV